VIEHKEMPEEGFKIIARVVSQKGTCGFGYKVGDEVVFDGETIQGRICLSALYSFIPKVYAWYGATLHGSGQRCGSPLTPITLMIIQL
jgi:uncharacterized repeat protein (TIGR04076 family)